MKLTKRKKIPASTNLWAFPSKGRLSNPLFCQRGPLIYHGWVLQSQNLMNLFQTTWHHIESKYEDITSQHGASASPCTAATSRHNYANMSGLKPLEERGLLGMVSYHLLNSACNAHKGGNSKLTAPRLATYFRHLQWVPCPPPLFLSLASLVPLAPSLGDGSHWPGTCKAYHLCSWTPSWGLKEEVEFLELPKAIITITIIITVNRLQSQWLLSIKWNNFVRTFKKRKICMHVSFYGNRVFVSWGNVFRGL